MALLNCQLRFTLLIFIILAPPTHTKSTQTTIEYWVRPDTASECPPDTPQHQCVTITDLVSYSNISSLNHGRNISIHFLPGVHIPTVEGRIFIEKSSAAHLSGIIKSHKPHSVTVVCSISKIALIFYHILRLQIEGITIKNCGYEADTIADDEKSLLLHGTIVIVHTKQIYKTVTITSVTVHNSTGYGLLVQQTQNDTTNSYLLVNISNSNIRYSNNFHYNKASTSFGGNILISARFENLDVKLNNTSISYGCNGSFGRLGSTPDIEALYKHLEEFVCGGLRVVAFDSQTFVTIDRSEFIGNEAITGGGIHLQFPGELTDQNDAVVEISDSSFIKNRATQNGGGINLISIAKKFDYENTNALHIMEVRRTLFQQNIAGFNGGGIKARSDKTDEYNIIECIFNKNSAKEEAAILLGIRVLKLSAISRSNFTNSFGCESVFGLLEAANIYLDTVNITDNQCRAVHMSKSKVFINNSVILDNNYAENSNGGGILIDCGNEWDTSVESNQIELMNNSHLHLCNNRAGNKGGGIYITRGCNINSEPIKYFAPLQQQNNDHNG